MTETTGTTGTAGPRPLFKAYDEAARENGWKKDGLMERAVGGMAFARMMDQWARWADCLTIPCFSLGEFYSWLRFGDGLKLCLAVVQSCVVCATDKFGPIHQYDTCKLKELEEYMSRTAFWTVGECIKGGYKWETTKWCIDRLAAWAGCDDEGWLKSLECSATPYRIPLDVLQKEEIDVEKIQAELKKLEVKK